MKQFLIVENDKFMDTLFKNSLFDSFLTQEITLYTDIKYKIDGTLHKNFHVNDNVPAAPFMSWKFLRNKIIHLFSQTDEVQYLEIIFLTTKEKTEQISTDAKSFILNIMYENKAFILTSAWSPKIFTMDKSAEIEWDAKIERSLLQYNFIK